MPKKGSMVKIAKHSTKKIRLGYLSIIEYRPNYRPYSIIEYRINYRPYSIIEYIPNYIPYSIIEYILNYKLQPQPREIPHTGTTQPLDQVPQSQAICSQVQARTLPNEWIVGYGLLSG